MVGMDNDRSNAQATFPLSEAARKCVGAFDHLTASLESPDEQSDGKLHSSVVKHQRDRFKIWAATLGALQRGRASLDFRLNETSLTKTTVLRFLEQLQQILLKSKTPQPMPQVLFPCFLPTSLKSTLTMCCR